MQGWSRESQQVRLTFWFQITKFGFDKYTGGKFIVEFGGSDSSRNTALHQRLWGLLDDPSRGEAHRINNDVIVSLPGPSDAVVRALSESVREAYLSDFQPVVSVLPSRSDVWFRYATELDVER
jgi:hypothetical protein